MSLQSLSFWCCDERNVLCSEEMASDDCAFDIDMQFGGSMRGGSYVSGACDFFSLIVHRVHYLGFLEPNPNIKAMGVRTGWAYWVDFEGALYDESRM